MVVHLYRLPLRELPKLAPEHRIGGKEMSEGQPEGGHVNAVDNKGNRYTTHCFAKNEDWWLGARILTPPVIAKLARDGVLPLTEVSE